MLLFFFFVFLIDVVIDVKEEVGYYFYDIVVDINFEIVCFDEFFG